jgi:hypothetical protein
MAAHDHPLEQHGKESGPDQARRIRWLPWPQRNSRIRTGLRGDARSRGTHRDS